MINKKGQKQKLRIFSAIRGKSGQEEFVGFGLIMIVVAVVLLIFVGFALKKNSNAELVESYEVESFIQTMLQYTTDCEDNLEFLSVQKLIFDCRENEKCLDGRNTCNVLNETLEKIIDASWNVETGSLVKGYELIVLDESVEMIKIQKGNSTNNYRGSKQSFSKSGSTIEIVFTTSY